MRIVGELAQKDKETLKALIGLMSEALKKKKSDELLEKIYAKIDQFLAKRTRLFGGSPPINKKFARLVQIWEGNLESLPEVEPHEAIAELATQFEKWWRDSGAKEAAEKPEQEKVDKVLRMMNAQAALVKKGKDGVTKFSNPFLDISRAVKALADLERSPNHRGFHRLAHKWQEVVEEYGFDDETDPLDD